MNTVTVTALAEKKIRKGVALLEVGSFYDEPGEEGVVELKTKLGDSLGMAYLSPQNKGIGWVIDRKVRPVDEDFFLALFEKARQRRESFLVSSDTTAYRLFHQDGDGFGGLSIDCYGDYAVFSWYNTFVYSLKSLIVSAFQAVFPHLLGGYEKIRFKGLDYETAHLYGESAPDCFDVLENGVSYHVFLNDGLMTGIFLDQHAVRGRLVDGLAAGKTVLNLFSYTAAFSVAAAMGGASRTTSVDLAKRSRELSKAHFDANGLELSQHELVVMDVMAYFKYAKRHQRIFDVIILDPPSFARNKKQRFSVSKDYHQLVSQAVDLLPEEGILILSTNAANLSLRKFRQQIERGLGQVKHQYLHCDRLPADFVINEQDDSSDYLKVFTIQVKK